MKRNKDYKKPSLTVVSFKLEHGYAASGDLFNAFRIGNPWHNEGNDAWDGSFSEGGNHFGSGWYDNGGSAWD